MVEINKFSTVEKIWRKFFFCKFFSLHFSLFLCFHRCYISYHKTFSSLILINSFFLPFKFYVCLFFSLSFSAFLILAYFKHNFFPFFIFLIVNNWYTFFIIFFKIYFSNFRINFEREFFQQKYFDVLQRELRTWFQNPDTTLFYPSPLYSTMILYCAVNHSSRIDNYAIDRYHAMQYKKKSCIFFLTVAYSSFKNK